jgi:hypothetical protein
MRNNFETPRWKSLHGTVIIKLIDTLRNDKELKPNNQKAINEEIINDYLACKKILWYGLYPKIFI